MPKFKLEDLSPKMRAQAEAQMRNYKPVELSSAAFDKINTTETRKLFKSQPKRIRQDPKPLMNGLETEFYGKLCNLFGASFVKPQAMRLKLGNGIWFKPDFFVSLQAKSGEDEMIFKCYEVKGPHAFRGGFENLKVAAHLWPEITFILAWKENGQWKEQLVLP